MGFVFFVFSFIWVFVLLWVLFMTTFLSSLKNIYHQKSSHYLQIKHNIRFLLQRVRLFHNLGFSWFSSQS